MWHTSVRHFIELIQTDKSVLPIFIGQHLLILLDIFERFFGVPTDAEL